MDTKLTAADLQVVLDSYEAIERRDLEAVLAVTSPQIVIETRVETHSGRDGARKMYEDAFKSDFTNRPEAMIVLDDRVAALTALRLVGGRTGIETEQKLIEVWTVSAGQVGRLQVIDREPGVESLGVAEAVAELSYLREGHEAFSRGDYDEVMMIATGERVLTIATLRARTSEMDAELSTPVQQLWTFQDGKAVRSDLFQSREEGLAALLADG